MENEALGIRELRRLEIIGLCSGVLVQIVAVIVKADLFFALLGAILILMDLLPDRGPIAKNAMKGAVFSSGAARGVVTTEIIGLVLMHFGVI